MQNASWIRLMTVFSWEHSLALIWLTKTHSVHRSDHKWPFETTVVSQTQFPSFGLYSFKHQPLTGRDIQALFRQLRSEVKWTDTSSSLTSADRCSLKLYWSPLTPWTASSFDLAMAIYYILDPSKLYSVFMTM